MFVGRKSELKRLEESYQSNKGELVVVYGRRRIGKSTLLKEFCKNKPNVFMYEALEERNTKEQIQRFVKLLAMHSRDSFINNIAFKDWESVFSYHQ